MAIINSVKCDNKRCGKVYDLTDSLSGEYHRLILGGSDFELSMMSDGERNLDFCSFECLKEWLFDEEEE